MLSWSFPKNDEKKMLVFTGDDVSARMAEAAQKVGNVKNNEANFGAVLNSSSWLVPAALNCNPELLSPPDAAICPPLADCSLTCRQQV